MNPPVKSIRAPPLLPQGLLWLMFVFSCIRATGWKLLSFPAVLCHIVNWLTGSDGAARIRGSRSGHFSSLPFLFLSLCELCAFTPLCQRRGYKGPWERVHARVWHTCMHTRSHTHTHTLSFHPGPRWWIARLKASLSRWRTCAGMCVPAWVWEECSGKLGMGKIELLVPALFV